MSHATDPLSQRPKHTLGLDPTSFRSHPFPTFAYNVLIFRSAEQAVSASLQRGYRLASTLRRIWLSTWFLRFSDEVDVRA